MFKENIKKLRKSRGLTQKEIAEELGITQPTYQQWESGKRSPTGETLEKLADFFNVSTDFLLGRNNSEQVGLSKFTNELNRRYDDVIVLSFMNNDFFGFCTVIEEIALNSIRTALGTDMTTEIVSDYTSSGFKRQEYLLSFREQIDNKNIKAIEIPRLKETVLEHEKQIASKYFV